MKDMIILIGKSGSGKNFLTESFNLNYTPGFTTRELRETDVKDLNKIPIEEIILYKKDAIFRETICGETFYKDNFYYTKVEDYNNPKYDYMILSVEGLQNFVTKYEKDKQKTKKGKKNTLVRGFKVIGVKSSQWKRMINMYKRGDKILDIIRRIDYDKKSFIGMDELVIGLDGIFIKN